MAFRRRGGPKPAPYNPNAVDADGDGIVQDGTIWERPAGSRFIDRARELASGVSYSDPSNLAGLTLVDFNGAPLEFAPSWTGQSTHIGTPLSSGLGLPTIGAGGHTIGDTVGVIGGDRLELPPNVPLPEDPLSEVRSIESVPLRTSFDKQHAVVSDSGILTVAGEHTINGEGFSKRVGRLGVMTHSDLPDTMYHVTTASDSVMGSGALRTNTGRNGLGGGTSDSLSVSLTTDYDIAQQLFEDMHMVSVARRDNITLDQGVALLQDKARNDGWEYTPFRTVLRDSVGADLKELFDEYFTLRESATHERNPLFFGRMDADPSQIRIVSVDSKLIPTNALVTDFSVGDAYGLSEVRVWGDVPIVLADKADSDIPMDQIMEVIPDLLTHADDYIASASGNAGSRSRNEVITALHDMVSNPPDHDVAVYVKVPKGLALPTDESHIQVAHLSETDALQHLGALQTVVEVRAKPSELRWDGGALGKVRVVRDDPTTYHGGPTMDERKLYPELFDSGGYLVEPERPNDLRRRPSPPPFSGVVEAIARDGAGFKSWRRFEKSLLSHDIVVYDYESTDLVSAGGKPTQLGAVKMSGGEIVDRFNLHMNPEVPYDQWSDFSKNTLRDNNGDLISPEFSSRQPSIDEAHSQFLSFVGETGILAGHNIKGFDLPMLQNTLDASRTDFVPDGIVDTLSLSRLVMQAGPDEVKGHTLGDMTDMFGIPLGNGAHTADADSEATARLLIALLGYAAKNKLSTDILDPDRAAKRYETELRRRDEGKTRFAELQMAYKGLLYRGYRNHDS